jgi:hypothetical protein
VQAKSVVDALLQDAPQLMIALNDQNFRRTLVMGGQSCG